jgi:UDP:flavonoid glycosyltransferase YjiC (YdhE family)
MLEAVSGWRPDVVVSEAGELAGGLAAEAAGVPRVRVHPGLANSTAFEEVMAPGIVELREGLGLEPDPEGLCLRRVPQVAYFPEELDEPVPTPAPILRVRDPRYEAVSGAPREDVVYVTLGTEAASLPFFADTLRAAVAGVVAAGLAAVVTTGRDGDPAVLSDLAGDVRVERWVDQATVLRTAKAVVCHAGAGTTLGALTAGVPVVAVPLFAEQPLNAARIAAVGAGVVVLPGPDLAARTEDAVRSVTTAAPPGSARLAAAIAALPDVSAALAVCEGVVRV